LLYPYTHLLNDNQVRSLWVMSNPSKQNHGHGATTVGVRKADARAGMGFRDPVLAPPGLVVGGGFAAGVGLQQQRRTFLGPLTRVVAQFAATAAVVFGKAFMQAFAEAQAAQKNPKAAAASMGMGKKTMELSQAYEVLSLSSDATLQEVEEKFEKMFKANDPDNGGSFYLQSKIYYARQVVLEHLDGGIHRDKEPNGEDGATKEKEKDAA
jgi:import inner membrane translocase subunit TIM16